LYEREKDIENVLVVRLVLWSGGDGFEIVDLWRAFLKGAAKDGRKDGLSHTCIRAVHLQCPELRPQRRARLPHRLDDTHTLTNEVLVDEIEAEVVASPLSTASASARDLDSGFAWTEPNLLSDGKKRPMNHHLHGSDQPTTHSPCQAIAFHQSKEPFPDAAPIDERLFGTGTGEVRKDGERQTTADGIGRCHLRHT